MMVMDGRQSLCQELTTAYFRDRKLAAANTLAARGPSHSVGRGAGDAILVLSATHTEATISVTWSTAKVLTPTPTPDSIQCFQHRKRTLSRSDRIVTASCVGTIIMREFIGLGVLRASLTFNPSNWLLQAWLYLPMIPFSHIVSQTPFVMDHIPTRPSPLPVVRHLPHLSSSVWQ
jgi:hypothetical protein